MTPKFNSLHTHALTSAGLTPEQAHVYELLIQKGPREAGQIPTAVDLSRPYVYKILQELIDLGLVTKDEPPGKPAKFVPVHPFAIQELVRKQKEDLSIVEQTVQGVMSSLISDYSSSSHLPGIRILPGIDGISELYQDVLQEKQDIRLIRSTYDDDTPELMELVLRQIQRQVSKNIQARLLGPLPTHIPTKELLIQDAQRLTTRRTIPRERFTLPAQILIYGDKVGITSYLEPHITTIVNNPAIAMTLGAIFEILWSDASEPIE